MDNINIDNAEGSNVTRKKRPNRRRRPSRNNKKSSFLKHEKIQYTGGYPKETLEKDIEILELPEKVVEAFNRVKIKTILHVIQYEFEDFYKIQGINKKAILSIIRALKKINIDIKPSTEKNKTDDNNNVTNASIKPLQNVLKYVADISKKPKQEEFSGLVFEQVKFSKRGKYGLKSRDNKIIIPAEYDDIFYIKEGLACAEKDGKYGYLNDQNEIVIPFNYDFALSFNDGYAVVALGNKITYIDKQANLYSEIKCEKATSFHDGKAFIKDDISDWQRIMIEELIDKQKSEGV